MTWESNENEMIKKDEFDDDDEMMWNGGTTQ